MGERDFCLSFLDIVYFFFFFFKSCEGPFYGAPYGAFRRHMLFVFFKAGKLLALQFKIAEPCEPRGREASRRKIMRLLIALSDPRLDSVFRRKLRVPPTIAGGGPFRLAGSRF